VHLWSASKTFTSLAVGQCQGEGRLTLADKVLDFFPEWADVAAPGSAAIRLVDLLHMCGGKDFAMFEETDEHKIDATDWAELFFRSRVVTTPGTRFFYANACTYMLGRVVEKVSGMVLRDYLIPACSTRWTSLTPGGTPARGATAWGPPGCI